jgi:hypothetical protein
MSKWDIVQAVFIHVSCQVENDGRRNKSGIFTLNVKLSLRTIVLGATDVFLFKERLFLKMPVFLLSCFSTGIYANWMVEEAARSNGADGTEEVRNKIFY